MFFEEYRIDEKYKPSKKIRVCEWCNKEHNDKYSVCNECIKEYESKHSPQLQIVEIEIEEN